MRTWILHRFQVYGRVCLISVAFLSPLIVYRPSLDPFGLVKLTAMWVLGAASLAVWITWSAERGVWLPPLRMAIPLTVFVSVCVLATVLSRSPALSLIGLETRFGGLVPRLVYVAIMLMIVSFYWEAPGDVKEIARGLAASSIVMSGYVLIQAAGLDWMGWISPEGEQPTDPVGTMGNSNFAGGFLGISAPSVLYLALAARRNLWKALFFTLTGMELFALWLTQSRGGLVAAMAGLLAIAFFYREYLPRWLKAAAILGLSLVVIVGVLVIWHPGSDRPPAPLSEISVLRTDTFQYRMRFWASAWAMFRDHPVLGTGLETYVTSYPRYRLPIDGVRFGFIAPDKPHNIYLEYATNAGILGVGSYLAVLGLALWYAVRRSRKLEASQRLLLAAFAGVLVGYMAQGFFSIDVPTLAVMGWVGLGGITTLMDPALMRAREAREAALEPPRFKKRAKKEELSINPAFVLRDGSTLWLVHLAVGLILIVLLAAGVRPLIASVKVRTAQTLAETPEAPPEVVTSYFRDVVSLNPTEASYHAYWGAAFERRALLAEGVAQRRNFLEQALVRHKQALKIRPDTVQYMINIARVFEIWGALVDSPKYMEAERWWKRSISTDPTNWEIYRDYAEFLEGWEQRIDGENPELQRRRADLLEKATRMRPDRAGLWIDLGQAYIALHERERAKAALTQALKGDPGNQEVKDLLSTF